MYCYTMITNIQCIFRELDMWTEISKEHPVFLKTVANLTDKDLPDEIADKLDQINANFEMLQKVSRDYGQKTGFGTPGWMNYESAAQVRRFVDFFLMYDREFLNLLKEIRESDSEDKVWQTLVGHIKREQQYMYRLFIALRKQLTINNAKQAIL